FIMETGSNGNQPLTPAVVKALKSVPGIDHFTDYTIVSATLTTPSGKKVSSRLSAADPSYTQDLRLDTVQGRLADAYGPDAMSLPEAFAKANHITVGDTVKAAFVGGSTATLK